MYPSVNSIPIFTFYTIMLIATYVIILKIPSSYLIGQNNQTNYTNVHDKQMESEVLLLYVWANTHSYAYGNLKYFIDVAVRENDHVDYYFILQRVNNKAINESSMPLLPKNGHYIQHGNICYDFGTFGWFLNEFTYGNPWMNETIGNNKKKKINLKNYKYFILMNSSVRGPFFPPYYFKFLSDYQNDFDKTFYWYYVFTKRLNQKVKLTGCTISCIPIPHVQSFVLVTDFIGFTIMLKPGSDGGSPPEGIFGCYSHPNHVSLNSEVPTSTRILESGYMIDSLLTKYQGVDFTAPHNQLCNQHKNPYLNDNFDGTSLDSYETVFIKFHDHEFLQVPRDRAKLNQRWMEDAQNPNRTIW